MKELQTIQTTLKAPKGQYNVFGKYKYRSCEDILEALKPILSEVGCTLTLSDEITQIGERIYVKATAVLRNGTGEIESTSAYAREDNDKKGMDGAQITGSASSYARKYALNGLFCIDDTKDPDGTNTHGKDMKQEVPNTQLKPKNEDYENNLKIALLNIAEAQTTEELKQIHAQWICFHNEARFMNALSNKKNNITKNAQQK